MRLACLALPLLLCSLLNAADTKTFDLADLRPVGCKVEGERVVLDRCFEQSDAPALAIEAEQCLDLIGTVQDDPLASGGKCVVRMDRALFPLNITRPGRYTRWVRGFFPQGGGWVHSESLDFSRPDWITDCDGQTAGRWVWVKGPTYDLSAGMHLLWLHNWHGGALLDKVILTPEGSPEPQDLGPAGLSLVPARQGWIATGNLPLPGLKRLVDCQWPVEARGGAVALSISLDGGNAFKPLNADTLAAGAGDQLAQVVLRADLTAAPDGASPAAATPSFTYEIDQTAFLTLENQFVRISFLRATGAVTEIYDKLAKTACLTAAGVGAPFALRHLPEGVGKPETIPDNQIKLLDLSLQKDGVTARYVAADGIAVILKAALKGPELTWTMEVRNNSRLALVEAVCPVLPGVRLGDTSEDNYLMVPQWQGGVETRDPVATGGDGVRYPTGGAMCWFDLYQRQPAHGLYLSGHDQSLLGCALSAEARRETDTLTYSLTKYAQIRPGKSWTGAPVVLGIHQGDWHVAADAYRAWAQTWMRKPTPPEWVREADGWYGVVTSADGARIPFRQMPSYLKSARDMGTNYLQVWGQMTGGANCDSLPYPNPVLGSLEDFKAAVSEIRRWGGHITFYVSSQFWKVTYGDELMIGSTPRDLLPAGVSTWDWKEWINCAIRGYDGSFSGDSELTPEQQTKYVTKWERTVPCPYTEAWAKRHLQYWCVDQYGRNYGASGIYLDETCAAGERICFAANHGHEHHGVWGSSLTRAMQDMVQGGRRLDPEWSFAMEGCGDAIGQFADMNLISPASAKKEGMWGATRRFSPECFHYTFPDYILYDGVANGMYGQSVEDCYLLVHLNGNRYDSFSVGPAAEYIRLRQRTKQLLYRARFMDTVGVQTSDPAVRAKVNVLQDQANDVRLINVANAQNMPNATITLALPDAARASAYYFDLEGQEGPVALQSSGKTVTFTAPTSRASTVLVATRCEPLIRVPTASLVAGDSGKLSVLITNPLAQPLKGNLRLDKPLPGAGNGRTPVTLPAQQTITVDLPLTVPATTARRCYNSHLTFESPGQTARRPVELLVTSPFAFTASLEREGVQVMVSNQSQVPQTGTFTVSGELWDKPLTSTLTIPAAGQSPLLLPLTEPLIETANLDVVVQSGAHADKEGLSVRPFVLNGSFEKAGTGGRPADWNYQNAGYLTMDRENPAEGEVCLKMVGEQSLFLDADQTIPTTLGQQYHATCQVRRTPEPGARVGPAVVLFLKQGGERYVYMTKTGNAPDDQWNEYSGDFTITDDVSRAMFYLYNVQSRATVWFDDVKVRQQ